MLKIDIFNMGIPIPAEAVLSLYWDGARIWMMLSTISSSTDGYVHLMDIV